jgi:hypothetical protein
MGNSLWLNGGNGILGKDGDEACHEFHHGKKDAQRRQVLLSEACPNKVIYIPARQRLAPLLA